MRHVFGALVGVVLTGICCCACADEGGFDWWPFDREKTADSAGDAPDQTAAESPQGAAAPATVDDEDAEPKSGWMFNSERGKVSWPRLQMPEIGKPNLPRPQLRPRNPAGTMAQRQASQPQRNAWAEEPEQPRTTPLQAMQNGARRMGDGTRSAWRKTVDVLTPGDNADDAARVAQRDAKPSLWQRMFGPEPAKKEGPKTVTEWMAQERLDP